MIHLPPELPPSVDKAVENLTDKPTKVIGKGVSSIFSLVFNPINHLNDKQLLKYAHALDVYKQELDDKISAIPEENLIEPKLQIVAQALEDSKYCIEEPELREMFANLIASASDKTKADIIHPSFSAILKQMSPKDAVAVRTIGNVSYFTDRSLFPVGRVKLRDAEYEDEGFLATDAIVDSPFDILEIPSDSLSNLLALGLISIDYSNKVGAQYAYRPLELFAKDMSKYFPDQEIVIDKGICILTPHGKNFTKSCGIIPTDASPYVRKLPDLF